MQNNHSSVHHLLHTTKKKKKSSKSSQTGKIHWAILLSLRQSRILASLQKDLLQKLLPGTTTQEVPVRFLPPCLPHWHLPVKEKWLEETFNELMHLPPSPGQCWGHTQSATRGRSPPCFIHLCVSYSQENTQRAPSTPVLQFMWGKTMTEVSVQLVVTMQNASSFRCHQRKVPGARINCLLPQDTVCFIPLMPGWAESVSAI